MPKRNAIKQYGAEQYYHVYNRGVAKMDIFRDADDCRYLLGLLKKYLTPGKAMDKQGRPLPNYAEKLDLVAFCFMPNHYHFLFYLREADGLKKFMASVMTAYSMYFNLKYKRTGGLFEGRFLASRITNDEYLWQVSRYIHLNPLDIKQDYRDYDFSSFRYFAGDFHAAWLHETWLVETVAERQAYVQDLAEVEDLHELYKKIGHLLANEE